MATTTLDDHQSSNNLTGFDVTALVIYLILLIGAGFYSMFKYNRSTVKGYFLANRQMPWLCIGASLFASNIGAEHFIGLASSGAAKGRENRFKENHINSMYIFHRNKCWSI